MCGIAGIVDPRHKLNDPRQVMESMLHSIRHRGPDDWGQWNLESAGVTLGHRRLSILDTSPSGRQPFHSPSKRYSFTYNGEIYNFLDLRKELGEIGHESTGDTAVVAAAFDRWGIIPSIHKFNGMFTFGIWDHQEERLTLIRDRLGKKPIYYGLNQGVFGFASELKPLRHLAGFCDEICPAALDELLKFGYVSSPRSIFRTVKKLRAGEYAELDGRGSELRVETKRYWQPSQCELGDLPEDANEFVSMIEEILTDSVKIRMLSDVPIGAFLSGGIDSSLVCALMQKVSDAPIKTFSIGFNESGFDEAVYAKKVAEHLGTDHHELYLTGEKAIELVDKIPTVYSEPFADSSQLPTYLVSQFARQSVTVALSGDGGDELFSGYSRYEKVLAAWKSNQTVKGAVVNAIFKTGSALAPAMMSKLVMKLAKRSHGNWGARKAFRREVERRSIRDFSQYYQYNNVAYPFADSLFSDEFRPASPSMQSLDWPEFGSNRVKMSSHDIGFYLPEDILTKVDRASMAVSLETRNPLLDYRLVAPALAGLDKYSPAPSPKWALKAILGKYVPRELFERNKQGFAIPCYHWLSGPLRPWSEELIAPNRLSQDGFFDPKKVSQAWGEFIAGDSLGWSSIFWRLIMFQNWHKCFFED